MRNPWLSELVCTSVAVALLFAAPAAQAMPGVADGWFHHTPKNRGPHLAPLPRCERKRTQCMFIVGMSKAAASLERLAAPRLTEAGRTRSRLMHALDGILLWTYTRRIDGVGKAKGPVLAKGLVARTTWPACQGLLRGIASTVAENKSPTRWEPTRALLTEIYRRGLNEWRHGPDSSDAIEDPMRCAAINRQAALFAGMAHEGTVFGLPMMGTDTESTWNLLSPKAHDEVAAAALASVASRGGPRAYFAGSVLRQLLRTTRRSDRSPPPGE